MTSPLSFACDPPLPSFLWSPYQAVTSKIYRLKQHFLPLQPLEVLLKLNKLFKKYASWDPSRCSQEKEVNKEKDRVRSTAFHSDYFI